MKKTRECARCKKDFVPKPGSNYAIYCGVKCSRVAWKGAYTVNKK